MTRSNDTIVREFAAPIMNVAVYELSKGLIVAWRDYTNPVYARELLRG